jgi:hypothetical protein
MSNSNTTQHHPHFAPEPVEVSEYTYDATPKPTTTVIHDHVDHDASKKHPATTASSLPATRIHRVEENTHHLHPAVEQPEVHDQKHTTVVKQYSEPEHRPETYKVVKQHPEPEHHPEPHHAEHHPEPEHYPEPHHASRTEHNTEHLPKPTPHHDPKPSTHQSIEPHTETHDHQKEQHASPRTEHSEVLHTFPSHATVPKPREPTHQHPKDHAPHHTPTSPSSTISSDSVQTPSSPSEIFGSPDRRQSWSKDEAKRGVMQGLLEKGKGKHAEGGYSSTDGDADLSLTL